MTRVLTSLLLIPLITYVVIFAPVWAFLIVLAAVALLCFLEFSGIVAGHGIAKPGIVGYAAGLVLLLSPPGQVLEVAFVLVALVALALALQAADLRDGLTRAGALVVGVIYIFGSWRCAIGLRAISPHWLFFALALNWIGDSAAYFVGRSIGRHKMARRVSPNKSWEGAAASVVASMIFGALYLPRVLSVPLAEVLIFAAVANMAGQLGDLAESSLKRGAGMKDSGTLLPGHGGWLDRVDSSLFAIPVVFALLKAAALL